jgi:hypothetical protein
MRRKGAVLSLCFACATSLAACSSSSVTAGKASPSTSGPSKTSSKSSTTGSGSSSTKSGSDLNPLGTTVTIPNTVSGIDKVTVSAFYPNVTDTSSYPVTPPAGHVWDAIVATTCAGPKGSSNGPDEEDFSLLLNNGSTASVSITAGAARFGGPLSSLTELGSSMSGLTPGQCVTGWIAFTVPTTTAPTAVEFSGTSASFTQPDSVVKWALPAS